MSDIEQTLPPGLERLPFEPLGDNSVKIESIDEQLRLEIARFRQRFAMSLFWLFAAVLSGTFIAIYCAMALEAGTTGSSDTAQHVLAAVEKYYPVALSAITGVFGTAVGFFFGSETNTNTG